MSQRPFISHSITFLGSTAGLVLAPTLAWAALAMVARSFCFQVCRTGTVSLLQTSVPDALRGRLMSTQFLLQQGASSVGVAAIETMADAWGLRDPILCGVAVTLVAWFVSYRMRAHLIGAFAVSAE